MQKWARTSVRLEYMFDLEKSVAEWRKQMLAAGISTSALDELESHLREEVAQQIRSGLDEQPALETAISQIGKGAELKKEFTKAKGLAGLLGEDTSTPLERILGALWLVFCFASLSLLMWRIRNISFFMGPILFALYGTPPYGSILLVRGAPLGRRIIRTIAAGFTVTSLFLILMRDSCSMLTATVTIFYAASAWLLFTPSFSKPTLAKK
jgi:hypothetical protein